MSNPQNQRYPHMIYLGHKWLHSIILGFGLLIIATIGAVHAGELLSLSDDPTEILPPEEAFQPGILSVVDDQITVQFLIKPGHYLYREKIKLLSNDTHVTIDAVETKQGILVEDEFFGETETYRDETLITAGFTRNSDVERFDLIVQSQGCADIGICYPPQEQTLSVNLPTLKVAGLISSTATGTTTGVGKQIATNSEQPLAEQDQLALALSTKSLWAISLTFFGLGLLLAFTPCVFPMIPILSSMIVGQGESVTTRKAFTLSLIYVLAMALTYTLAGIAVGLSGENVQVWFQNPWVLSAFALVFVLLSLSMFGYYELEMPTGIQQKLSNLSNRQQGGTYIGAGIMGFLSALIVGPCVTAPLVGALIFIADTGNALVGGVALFCLSLGMGAPLLVIGTSAGRWLPKNGAWMDTTKAIFGILLLALAIWMLSRFLPAGIIMALSAALAIVTGIFLGATDSVPSNSGGWRKVFKGAGLVSLLYGASLLIGALGGGHSLLQPLSGFVAMNNGDSTNSSSSGPIQFQRVKAISDLNQVIAQATAENRPVMLDFYADWCVSCKEMEAFTFTDKNVVQRLENVLLIQADVTLNDADDKALLKKFGLFGPPGIIFYDPDGNEIRNARIVGYMPADKFTAHLDSHLFSTTL